MEYNQIRKNISLFFYLRQLNKKFNLALTLTSSWLDVLRMHTVDVRSIFQFEVQFCKNITRPCPFLPKIPRPDNRIHLTDQSCFWWYMNDWTLVSYMNRRDISRNNMCDNNKIKFFKFQFGSSRYFSSVLEKWCGF